MPSATTSARRPSRSGTVVRQDLPAIHARVLRWFDEHARAFPWRAHRDPYRTMVAEVMLQQTQTGRVAPAYVAFLRRFPTLTSLARASAMDVIRAWQGLGYNRRAVQLQRAAQIIEHDHGGVFPPDSSTLRTLPGIGEYTSTAIACFAFDEQVAVVDVNVRRVLARAALGSEPDGVAKRLLDETARAWLPVGDAYRWNQALMDVGATMCRSGTPVCAQCPLRPSCAFHAAGQHVAARTPRARASEPFSGSRRQKRGRIVDALRSGAARGVTLASLAAALHPDEPVRDVRWLVELLEGLERDRLIEMTPAAREGSPRGFVRLPR